MLSLALRSPSRLRSYVSSCLKVYDELTENGLPSRGPLTPAEDATITLPAYHAGGGMSFAELAILARVTKTLKPRMVFEIGTYHGLTTAVFLLNADPDARIVTLDLPIGPSANDDSTSIDGEGQSGSAISGCLAADRRLVTSRRLGAVPQALGLSGYTQLLCDSILFDPTPYLDCVDLGLIDGAHDLVHVQNDTRKMARMMSDRGMVFWHDYGGKGALRPLASYLETLGRHCALYRISDTSLAWAGGRDIKNAIEQRVADP
jgi:hypothetical protein